MFLICGPENEAMSACDPSSQLTSLEGSQFVSGAFLLGGFVSVGKLSVAWRSESIFHNIKKNGQTAFVSVT